MAQEEYHHNNWIRDKYERGTRRVWMLRKRLQTCQEGRMGIKNLGGRRPLYLRNPMEQTQGNFGSLKELGAAGIRMIHRAKVAGRKDMGFRDKEKMILHQEKDGHPG
jgi:hypothetical protein